MTRYISLLILLMSTALFTPVIAKEKARVVKETPTQASSVASEFVAKSECKSERSSSDKKQIQGFSAPDLSDLQLSCDKCMHYSENSCSYIDMAPIIAIVEKVRNVARQEDCNAYGFNVIALCQVFMTVDFETVQFIRNTTKAKNRDYFIERFTYGSDPDFGDLAMTAIIKDGVRLEPGHRYLIVAGPSGDSEKSTPPWMIASACNLGVNTK